MCDATRLVTTCHFKDVEYLASMSAPKGLGLLELSVMDKLTSEEWKCSYDASYIESLTHKTGNYKQFDVFITMVRSGLLKTSECVSLELLTFEDLEALRSRKGRLQRVPLSTTKSKGTEGNRRYLIITYTVEFDRIHYPLPLEYCGPPDPQVQQATIRRLNSEVARLQGMLQGNMHGDISGFQQDRDDEIMQLKHRLSVLSAENQVLREQLRAKRPPSGSGDTPGGRRHEEIEDKNLQEALRHLEKGVLSERASHHRLVQRLRQDKVVLSEKLSRVQESERALRSRLRTANRNLSNSPCHRSQVGSPNGGRHGIPSQAKSCPTISNNDKDKREAKASQRNRTEGRTSRDRFRNMHVHTSPNPVKDHYSGDRRRTVDHYSGDRRRTDRSTSRSSSKSFKHSNAPRTSHSPSVYMMRSANDLLSLQQPPWKSASPTVRTVRHTKSPDILETTRHSRSPRRCSRSPDNEYSTGRSGGGGSKTTSRGSSRSSEGSKWNRKYKKHDHELQSSLRHSTERRSNYRDLEDRIQALQDLITDGMVLKKQ